MTEVRVEGLVKRFDAVLALDAVSLRFPDGQFFGLLGPSGSGKTTLLRAIAGFVTPDAGHIQFDGQPVERVPVEAREIGMVFQNYALFPNMTVAENVAFGLSVRKVSRADQTRRVAEALDLVQLGPLGARKPHQLSGGQRQRVAMARAIVTRPRVLLLDEPLSALDKSLRVEMQIELKRIQREVGITTIFVTHDQEEALTLSDRIGILRDGRLIRHGTPHEVYDDPGDAFTARFLGEANLMEVRSTDGALLLLDGTAIRPPQGTPTDTIALRPELLTITPEEPASGNRLRGTMGQRVFAGAMASCIVALNGQSLKVMARSRDLRALPEQGEVWLSWNPEDARWIRP